MGVWAQNGCLYRLFPLVMAGLVGAPAALPSITRVNRTSYHQPKKRCKFKTPSTIPTECVSLFFFFLIFGCIGSSLLHAGFLQLWRAGATLRCSARASHCGGFSCCGARALGAWASVVVARGLRSCGSQALEHRLSSCGTQAQLLHSMWYLQGLNPCPLHWQADSQPLRHQGSPECISLWQHCKVEKL